MVLVPMDLLDTADIAEAMRTQAEHCLRHDAPITASIVRAQIPLMDGPTQCGQRIAQWPGKPLEDAMPLRLTGGLHHLYLVGKERRLAETYQGVLTDQAAIDELIAAVVTDHDSDLLAWFEHPPQTNEAGRSAGFMAGLLWLSGRLGSTFELHEIGASAGVNTMMDRYHYDLNGTLAGPADSPMPIRPEWKGPPPPQAPVQILSTHACDLNPIDLTDDAVAMRLKGYIWPEMPQRFQRMEVAISLAKQKAPHLVKADAGDWVEEQLQQPPRSGVTRVLMHSIVWQYLPETTRTRIETALLEAGAKATRDAPLALISVETNRATFKHEVTVRYWPHGDKPVHLGNAHAHGAWIEWFGN